MQIKSNKLICFGLVLFTIMTMGIASADSLDVELFNNFGGIVNDVEVSGTYAYVSQGSYLVIYDISNISNPLEVGRSNTPSADITIADNYAYLADSNGLSIVDITDPSSPKLVSSCDTVGFANSIAVSGNYAYIADENNGLVIIDITDKSTPKIIETYSDDSAYAVTVAGNYAYIADYWDGIVIVNISNPSVPIFTSSYDTSCASDIAVEGNYAYVADSSNGLLILDVSNPATPTLIGKYNDGGSSVTLSGDYAYVGGYMSVSILDITDPSSPILVGSYEKDGTVEGITIAGDYAYIAGGTYGFTIINISTPSLPKIVGNYGLPGMLQNIVVTDKYAYIADGMNGLEIFDSSRKLVGRYDGPGYDGYVSNVIVSGNYAYLTWSLDPDTITTHLVIVDISDPTTPTYAGIYGHIYPHIFAVEGDYAYVQGVDNYLEVVDVSDPTETKLVASYDKDYVDAHGLPIYPFDTSSSIDQTTTTSYPATYDNRLRESSPSSVLSTTTYVDLGKSTSISRDVMMFDLSDYETTDTIDKAILSLYWYYPADKTRTSDTVVEIYRPVEWDSKYVSWKNSVSGKAWATAGGSWYDKNGVSQGTTPYASITFPAGKVPDNKYYEFDVTDLVQEYVSGEYDNTGFFLKAKDESGNYIAFYSSDWSNAEQRPKLTITSISGFADDTPADEPVDEPVDELPVAHAGDDIAATTGSAVNFDASASTDDNGIDSYSWDFDVSDGITSEATGIMAENTYASPGTYTVTLTVTDTAGQKSTDTLKVIVKSSSVTYTPVYDNRLRESSPSTVLPTTGYIDVGRSTSISRDVMMFDLSDYQTTDKISKATLSLYWYYPADKTRNSETVVEVYRPIEWDSRYVSWKYSASGKAWANAGGSWYDKNGVVQGTAPYASVTFSASKVPDNKYYEFNVTDLVQEYISGESKNTGFLLKAKTENGNYIALYSSDWTNAEQRPKLTITS